VAGGARRGGRTRGARATVTMRTDGYAPIRDYAVIGDGRTAALVARDGAVDWLCLPNFDSPSVFARILDAERGGSFTLAPAEKYESERRYEDDSNVLETVFRTASGTVRVQDAMTLPQGDALVPLRELVRRVECLSGRVEMRFRLEPSFDFGRARTWFRREGSHWVTSSGTEAMGCAFWGVGDTELVEAGVEGMATLETGQSTLIALTAAHCEPLLLAGRADAEARLEQTRRFWMEWSARASYDGPWRSAVVRSALALKLLVFSPSGAIVAAPTTSLPEWIGGSRNWDYRFTWIRDGSYTLDALLGLGYDDEAHAFFWWLMHASRLARPRLETLYRVHGGTSTDEQEVARLAGYRGSRPVRLGNAAAEQVQLDVYGAFLNAVWRHVEAHGTLEAETGRSVAKVADFVAEAWQERDSGIWEVRSEPLHFIQSKAMCWAALDRAVKLAERDCVPDRRGHWRAEAGRIRRFVDDHGWDQAQESYVRAPEDSRPDGSLLTLFLVDYDDPRGPRLQGTLEAIRRELKDGPLVDRYRDDDGVGGEQGVFLTCSFWFADALARSGRLEEAAALMDDLVGLANDVGLYAEEIAQGSGEFLGNFPQALVHLALINAAVSIERARERR
jgi:GH15 family glucan-1,4-alpha-glucosidase